MAPMQQTALPSPTAAGQTPFGDNRAALREKFPPRLAEDSWPTTTVIRDELITRLTAPPFRPDKPGAADARRRGVGQALGWLEFQPGASWQERWKASGAEQTAGQQWAEMSLSWHRKVGRDARRTDLSSGLLMLLCGDVIRPSTEWMLRRRPGFLGPAMELTRDPEGFARLRAQAAADAMPAVLLRKVLYKLAVVLACKGGQVSAITVGDCVELLDVQDSAYANGGEGKAVFYQLLHRAGLFPADAPPTVRAFRRALGQSDIETMVDRYRIACKPVRDLLVDYLRERQPKLDYVSLNSLAHTLAGLFWKDIELHHRGIESIRLETSVANSWKQRIRTKTATTMGPDGKLVATDSPRESIRALLTQVRAFYLDIAQWAAEDPARWGQWAVPSPVTASESSMVKQRKHRKAKMDQRTRERLPVLPVLAHTADRRRKDAAALLRASLEVEPGATFSAAGETLIRPVMKDARVKGWAKIIDAPPGNARRYLRDLSWEEEEAFWSWATIEVLRHTGIRIEELSELSHHSFVQYTLPTTGEVVPLLQIAPSKTDEERLLLISPELADVLSQIVLRIRDISGGVPLAPSYDEHERVWLPPMPLLFQRRVCFEDRAIPRGAIRKMLNKTLTTTGLTDPSGDLLKFQPHDFRRIFITDAILNGLPPHIAQVVAGHSNINTTMGYKAVYPMEAIEAHRAFIARRRATRPSEEYRVPTEEEWDAFLAHFEKRRVALGTCGRAYGTPCIHEHACVRCSLLRPDPAQRPYLEEIRDNLNARIAEAEREGWLGEVDGLQISLAGAEQKLAQMDELATGSSPVPLGIPRFLDRAGRADG